MSTQNMNETSKILLAQQELLNPTTIWILFLFLGWSYGSFGQGWKQFFFYITIGGLGVWMLIRLFTLSGAIKAYNKQIYAKYGIDGVL